MTLLFIFLLFLFSLFFTFDNKPINLLLDFIGIILSLSFSLFFLRSVDFSFFSFLFLIIYGSALAILFAFIIMLFHSNSPSVAANEIKLKFKFYYLNKLLSSFSSISYPSSFFSGYKYFFAIFSFSCLCYLLLYYYFPDPDLAIFNIATPASSSINLIYFIFSSFIFNFSPLILIINILLLGFIGVVFLLI